MDGIAELKELPKIFSKIFENRVHESGLRVATQMIIFLLFFIY